MASACMSLPYVRAAGLPGSVAASPEGRFSVKQAACTPIGPDSALGRSSCRFPPPSLSIPRVKSPILYTRKILGHPSFAFNPSEYEPFTAEELVSRLSEKQAFTSNTGTPSQEQSSEYKPFSLDELEQKVNQTTSFKSSKQKHKTVSSTYQPLGPEYPPITLEELEAKIAESNYKPFSRFEGKADATSTNPLGSEYKPFTVEELEQKVSESTYKPLSKQESKPYESSYKPLSRQDSKPYTPLSSSQPLNSDPKEESKPYTPLYSPQPLSSDPKPNVVSEQDKKTGESSFSSFSGDEFKVSDSPFKPGDPSYKPFTVEELLQSSYDLGFRPYVPEEGDQSLGLEPSSSDGSGGSSESAFTGVEPPRLTKLYVGNVPWNYTNQDLDELFKQHGSVFVAEVVLDKATGRSRGFGFVYMNSPEDAEVAIKNLDGQILEGRPIKVSYQESAEERAQRMTRSGGFDVGNNVNKLFVANLPWRADDEALKYLFSDYGTVIQARVVYDRETGRSKGYGFVTLSSADEVNNAISSLNGSDYEGRPLKVALAGERPASRGF